MLISRGTATLLAAFLLPFTLARAGFAMSADELEVRLVESWQGQTSITADLRIEAEMMDIAVSGTGKLAALNEGGVTKYTQRFVLELPAPLSVQATMDVLYDGQFTYLVREMLGEKEAFKLTPGLADSAPPPGGKLLFDLLKSQYTLAVGDNAVEGKRPVFTLLCEPKEGTGAEPITLLFDKETGLALKTEIRPKDAARPVVITYENLATNTELNPAQFVFTLSDGAQLQDKTSSAAETAPNAPESAPVQH